MLCLLPSGDHELRGTRGNMTRLVGDAVACTPLDTLMLHATVQSSTDAMLVLDLAATSAGSCLPATTVHAVTQLRQTYLPAMAAQNLQPVLELQQLSVFYDTTGEVYDVWHIGSASQLHACQIKASTQRAQWEEARTQVAVDHIRLELKVRWAQCAHAAGRTRGRVTGLWTAVSSHCS
jgi:hypothetical protein